MEYIKKIEIYLILIVAMSIAAYVLMYYFGSSYNAEIKTMNIQKTVIIVSNYLSVISLICTLILSLLVMFQNKELKQKMLYFGVLGLSSYFSITPLLWVIG